MSEFANWSAVAPITGASYTKLLDCGERFTRYALLVVQTRMSIAESGIRLLEALSPKLSRQYKANEWPGTGLLGEEATIHEYVLDGGTVAILRGATRDLFGWRQPDLPEDLALLRSDRTAWLTSISHERDAYLSLSREEVEALLALCPDTAALFQEEATADG